MKFMIYIQSLYEIIHSMMKTTKHDFPKAELPKLDYEYDDLDPVIPEELLKIHHTKHHQLYIDNYNKYMEEFLNALVEGDFETIAGLTKEIKFNGGSHINHSIYWKNLAPIKNGGGQVPDETSPLVKHIVQEWGSVDTFIKVFIDHLMKIQGSGWGALVYCKNTKTLCYLEVKDQDPVSLTPGKAPILLIDAWEHSWYLKYKNEKKKYYTDIWKIINWKDLEERYNNAIAK